MMAAQLFVDDEVYQLLARTAQKWGFGPEDLGNVALLAGLGALSTFWANDVQSARVALEQTRAALATDPLRAGPRPPVHDR